MPGFPPTPNKQLQLITPGADTDQWGNDTNSNWSIVDMALGGSSQQPIQIDNTAIQTPAGSGYIFLTKEQVQAFRQTVQGSIVTDHVIVLPNCGGFWFFLNFATQNNKANIHLRGNANNTEVILLPSCTTFVWSDGNSVWSGGMGRWQGAPNSGMNLISTGGPAPIGTVIDFAGYGTPSGFLQCDGTVYASSEYPELAVVIQNAYGGTNWSNLNGTFAVPDLRARVVAGYDPQQTYRMTAALAGGINAQAFGATGGDEGHQQQGYEMAYHTHNMVHLHEPYEGAIGTNPLFLYHVKAGTGNINIVQTDTGLHGLRYINWTGQQVNASGGTPITDTAAAGAQWGNNAATNPPYHWSATLPVAANTVQPTAILQKVIYAGRL